MLTDRQYSQIQLLLKERNLNLNLFKDKGISFAEDISVHAIWANENMYCVPFPGGAPRILHSGLHACRTAAYVVIIINFLRRYHYVGSDTLSNYALKLMQIAMLFHDSARMSDGIDHWDKESALFLYAYLVNVLKIDVETAQSLAESVANKDQKTGTPVLHLVITDEEFCWESIVIKEQDYIVRDVIHDTDCLFALLSISCSKELCRICRAIFHS
jgi:hypothetical protein